jgi:hypothetical protein
MKAVNVPWKKSVWAKKIGNAMCLRMTGLAAALFFLRPFHCTFFSSCSLRAMLKIPVYCAVVGSKNQTRRVWLLHRAEVF